MLHLDLEHPWRFLLPKACVKVEGAGTVQNLQCGLDFAHTSSKQMKDPGRACWLDEFPRCIPGLEMSACWRDDFSDGFLNLN